MIYQYLGRLDPKLVEEITEMLAPKMGDISYVVIDDQFDITVLKKAKEDKVFVA